MKVSNLNETLSFREFISLFPKDRLERAFEFLFLKSQKVRDFSSYHSFRNDYIDFETKSKLVNQICNNNIPISRFTEQVFFNNQKLELENGVFIPRVETECLIKETINWINKLNLSAFSYIDLCCGSGNIFLEIFKEFESNITTAVAIDFSLSACKNTLKNIELRNVKNAQVYLANWAKFLEQNSNWEVITINPPYLGEEELKATEEYSLKRYDPKWALEGGDNGWSHYRKILDFANINPYWKLIVIECSEFHEFKWNEVISQKWPFKINIFRDYLDKFRGVILSRGI